MYFLTFHMAFEAWIRSENCICSGTAVFYTRNLRIKFLLNFLLLSLEQLPLLCSDFYNWRITQALNLKKK